MRTHPIADALVSCSLLFCAGAHAQVAASTSPPIEYLHAEGQHAPTAPFSPGVKVGNLLFVSGIPAFDKDGKLAVNDFTAQMNQVMDNITGILKAAGVGWDRVYAAHFQAGKYPARTTAITLLPNPDFLLEIECVAALP
jgi:enamine deaminase RidA (YjgF/YER057c/UK114 family)